MTGLGNRMNYYFAPMEGITYYNFRQIHHKFFPGIDKYFTPFVVATYTHKMKSREKRDILPENNIGVPVVPQILTKDPAEFVFCAKYMADFGYTEVNLNAGCPVGTVTAKGKGAGLLKEPERLDALLDGIFNSIEKEQVTVSGVDGEVRPLSVSVKTRLGWENPEEFEKILEVYRRYPVSELMIHARTRKELYSGEPEIDAFAKACEAVAGWHYKVKLCYNGNIRAPEDVKYLEERFPKLDSVMIGRGLLQHPGLVATILTGEKPDMQTIQSFHDELYSRYLEQFGDVRVTIDHMKELWGFLEASFPDSGKYIKAIRKARKREEYEAITAALFSAQRNVLD